ncbi:MAG: hypothetical protein K2R98_31660 [Gemmataceae bacterium]|nr:hypothetical protein [Gemmataceae bacterium]
MSLGFDDAQRAEGCINIAIIRLLEKYPFHARVLEQFQIRVRPDVGTMAVSVVGDDLLLYHNPPFVLSLPAAQLGGVLLHEVHHVVFGHLLADPADYPDDWARVVAEETVVNEYIREPLTKGAIRLRMFPDLPRRESTSERYARLASVVGRRRIDPPKGCSSPDPEAQDTARKRPSTCRSDGDAGAESDPEGGAGAEESIGKSASKHRRGANGAESAGQPLGNTVDDHSVWAEARQEPERSQAVIRDAMQQAMVQVGPEQVPAMLKDIGEGLGIGSAPSDAARTIERDAKGRLNWTQHLRQYIGRALHVRPVFNRPPRRFPQLVGIMPGRRRQAAKPKILAVIDTSGSITQDLLRIIDAELARLARMYTVMVVECDCTIHRVYAYRRIKSVQGGGGTDFRPPLEPGFLRKSHVDLVVYFTDGLGPAPPQSPKIRVIWCLTPEGREPASWGRAIWMAAKRPEG